jgi:hypothetical protein
VITKSWEGCGRRMDIESCIMGIKTQTEGTSSGVTQYRKMISYYTSYEDLGQRSPNTPNIKDKREILLS